MFENNFTERDWDRMQKQMDQSFEREFCREKKEGRIELRNVSKSGRNAVELAVQSIEYQFNRKGN